jgi:hypothetical protein
VDGAEHGDRDEGGRGDGEDDQGDRRPGRRAGACGPPARRRNGRTVSRRRSGWFGRLVQRGLVSEGSFGSGAARDEKDGVGTAPVAGESSRRERPEILLAGREAAAGPELTPPIGRI